MGMSTHVIGLSDPDFPEFKLHAAVLVACVDAGVDKLPLETAAFFRGGEYPDKSMLDDRLSVAIPMREWEGDCAGGYEIDVADIPPGVTTIRFWNSY